MSGRISDKGAWLVPANDHGWLVGDILRDTNPSTPCPQHLIIEEEGVHTDGRKMFFVKPVAGIDC